MRLRICLVMAVVGCGRDTAAPSGGGATTAVATPVAGAAPSLPAQVEPPNPHPVPKIDTLTEAVAFFRPRMFDQFDAPSDGTVGLAKWAADHLKWSDVEVVKNETGFGMIKKEPDDQVGKRMCASGRVIQIQRQKLSDSPAKLYDGLLMVGGLGGDLIQFWVAGSSGEIVEKSEARICGVVTGRFDYTNSAGGTGHAVSVVGMFDLPENKPPPASKPAVPAKKAK